MIQNVTLLQKIKEWLILASYSCYFIPLADEHAFEYIDQQNSLVKHLSGFTGSLAYLIITKDKNYILTDSRYWLQVEKEVGDNWTLLKYSREHLTLEMEIFKNIDCYFFPSITALNVYFGFKKYFKSFSPDLIPSKQKKSEVANKETQEGYISALLQEWISENTEEISPGERGIRLPLLPETKPLAKFFGDNSSSSFVTLNITEKSYEEFMKNNSLIEKEFSEDGKRDSANFSSCEHLNPLAEIIARMVEERVEIMVVSNPSEISYILNTYGMDYSFTPSIKGYLVIQQRVYFGNQENHRKISKGVIKKMLLKEKKGFLEVEVEVFLYYRDSENIFLRKALDENMLKIVAIKPLDGLGEDLGNMSGQIRRKNQTESTKIGIDPTSMNFETFCSVVGINENMEGCEQSGNLLKISESVTELSKTLDFLYLKGLTSRVKAVKSDIQLRFIRLGHIRDSYNFMKFWLRLEQKLTKNFVEFFYNNESGLNELDAGYNSGLTEVDAINLMEEVRRQDPYYFSHSFSTIAGSGKNAAIVHYSAQETFTETGKSSFVEIEKPLLVDTGGQYLLGVTTDVTRVIIPRLHIRTFEEEIASRLKEEDSRGYMENLRTIKKAIHNITEEKKTGLTFDEGRTLIDSIKEYFKAKKESEKRSSLDGLIKEGLQSNERRRKRNSSEIKEKYTLLLSAQIKFLHSRISYNPSNLEEASEMKIKDLKLSSLDDFRNEVFSSVGQLEKAVRGWLRSKGVEYGHGTGHGIGAFSDVHESPFGLDRVNALPPSVITSCEPGYYKAGEYGLRLENDFVSALYQAKKESSSTIVLENLTWTPYENNLIDWCLLSEEETEFLKLFNRKALRFMESLFEKDGRKEEYKDLIDFIKGKTETHD